MIDLQQSDEEFLRNLKLQRRLWVVLTLGWTAVVVVVCDWWSLLAAGVLNGMLVAAVARIVWGLRPGPCCVCGWWTVQSHRPPTAPLIWWHYPRAHRPEIFACGEHVEVMFDADLNASRFGPADDR